MSATISDNSIKWTKINLRSSELAEDVKLSDDSEKKVFKKKPNWLRVKLPTGKNFRDLRKLVDKHKLHTICESGNCPNMGECWGAGTATFMILGIFVQDHVVFVLLVLENHTLLTGLNLNELQNQLN